MSAMGTIGMSGVIVMSSLLAMVLIINLGYFDGISVECGSQHYAENFPPFLPFWLKKYIPMPFNVIVNLGYLVVGYYWLSNAHGQWVITFSWMSLCYGIVQSYRIIFQTTRSAILDQWVTLPFFAWTIFWCLGYLEFDKPKIKYLTPSISLFSFSLTLISDIGFEISLLCHIVSTIALVSVVLHKFGDHRQLKYFVLAILSCTGFVFLKLYDHEIREIYPSLFSYLTGHFWSKICDFMQIHYTCMFVTTIQKHTKIKLS